MSKGLFITGTGTDIGKTYITALIVKKLHEEGLKAAYYKAAMSGNERDSKDNNLLPGDAIHVKEVSGIAQSLESMCPYVYERAYSPHLAARIEGGSVEMSIVKDGYNRLSKSYDYITMEGSGGIVCPIRHDALNTKGGIDIQLEDIIKELKLPSLIIADAGLGTINSVVLTTEYMLNRKMPIKGIIFNGYRPGDVMQEDNLKMCEYYTGIEVISCVEKNAKDLPLDVSALEKLYTEII